MKSLVLLFPTFLKLVHFSLPERKKILAGRFRDNGYDYYWSAKKAVREFALGAATLEECRAIFANLNDDNEAKHNAYCFETFHKWFLERPRSYFPPPRSVFRSEHGLLQVKIEPEICFELNGQKRSLHMWNALEPELEVAAAAISILLMRQNLFLERIGDIRCGVFHGRTANEIWDEIVAEDALALLPREVRATESIWIELNKERIGRDEGAESPHSFDSPSPDDQKGPPE